MTICAISTPPGIGGIAVVRISGPEAIEVADRVWRGKPLGQAATHTAHLGVIADPANGNEIDQAVATVFRAPRSFTGEDVVELSVHGSRWIQTELVNLLIRCGCRLADPGEFTRRAFTNGRIDLAEAEAVADVIAAESEAANRVAQQQLRGTFSRCLGRLRDGLVDLASLIELELDFAEEHVEFADRTRLLALAHETLATVDRLSASFAAGQAIKNGVPVAIVGAPNAGKSSLLNMLLHDDRAIVSDIPGTTRDTIEDTTTIGGLTFRFIDTAGLRRTTDAVENLGIGRTWTAISRARIILWVVDASLAQPQNGASTTAAVASDFSDDARRFAAELAERAPSDSVVIAVLNKTDLLADEKVRTLLDSFAHLPGLRSAIAISASAGTGLDALRTLLSSNAFAGRTTAADASNSTPSAIAQHKDSATNPSQGHLRSELPVEIASADAVIVTNARHYEALLHASESLQRVIDGLQTTLPADLVAQDVRETIHHLSTITGDITTPDILTTIFSRFCVGK